MTEVTRRQRFAAALCGIGLLTMGVSGAAAQPQTAPLSLSATDQPTLRIASDLVDLMVDRRELRPRRVVNDPLVPGRRHERLQQVWNGVPVLGATLTRQIDGDTARSIFGGLHPDIRVDVTPSLSAEEAVLAAFGSRQPPGAPPPGLAIVGDAARRHRLVYQVTRFLESGLYEILVDAHDGARVRVRNTTTTQTAFLPCPDCAVGSGQGVKGDRKKMSVTVDDGAFTARDGLRPSALGTYDMRGDWRRTLDVLTGAEQLRLSDLAVDLDNDWSDGASVDAHAGTGWFTDYLHHRFGRQGLDDRHTPVVTLVHPVRRADLLVVPPSIRNLFHLNAFYCGVCGPFGMLVYGEGLPDGFVLESTGQAVDFFAAGLDIVGHELGHAVTDFSTQLEPAGEPGALSEAFSDIVGAGVEFFVAETGRHRVEQADYLIGEDVVRPGGIRSLSDPQSLGDPDHLSKRFTGTADNGGVHTNSLIASHAFYLAVEGGTNRTSGLQVDGVGPENRARVEEAFYRAFVFMLPADATFGVARVATIQSARDLAGEDGSRLEQAIAAAWDAVGVE